MGRCDGGWTGGVAAWMLGAIALAGCSSSDRITSNVDPRYGVAASPRVVEPGQPVPKGGGAYRTGKPYMVAGRMYYPEENPHYRSEGLASWYGEDFHGRLTANGEVYDMNGVSAAHPTLPMPCYARVTNLTNRRSLIVRINDRGPYHGNREIDLSGKAAELLGFRDNGLARVRVEYAGAAPLEGSDDRMLVATLREGAPAPAPSGVMMASTKPFVPEVTGRSPLLDVPLPPDRPFDLGETPDRGAALYPAELRTVATRAPSPERAAPRSQWAAGRPPLSAYAPARDEESTAVSSVRGLY